MTLSSFSVTLRQALLKFTLPDFIDVIYLDLCVELYMCYTCVVQVPKVPHGLWTCTPGEVAVYISVSILSLVCQSGGM